MPKRVVAVPKQPTLLELVSRGRKGPGDRLHLTAEQIEAVARTVRGVPEVVVKVSGGARDMGGAEAHLAYIDRHGKLAFHTDDGREIQGKDAAAELARDWNLDLSKGQYRPAPAKGEKDTRPKVVHNLVLSMPGRTPPEAVLAAAQAFAREQFGLQYRYAMVLHTDQEHPHVHLVVKAEHEYEPGQRLYIRKATLQQWREAFAGALREQGVSANATPRQIRGENRSPKKDAIHHRMKEFASYARLPNEIKVERRMPKGSTFMRRKVEQVARELQAGVLAPDPSKAKFAAARETVRAGWLATVEALRAQGQIQLASEVEAFARTMPAARTDKELVAASLLVRIEAQHSRSASLETSRNPK